MNRNLYARSKDELISMAQMICREMGLVVEINYVENEEDGQDAAFFPAIFCYMLCDNLPLTAGGIQRKDDTKKVRNIRSQALSADPPCFRTNVLLNLQPERFNKQVKSATGQEAFIRVDDKKHSYFFFLEPILKYLKQLPTDSEGNLLDTGNVLLGTIVDGQNRIAGLMQAGPTDPKCYFKKLAANVKYNQNRQQTAKDAYDTNEPQRQPSRDASLAMGLAAQALSPEKTHSCAIVKRIYEVGPLKGVAPMYEKDEKSLVSSDKMANLVMRWLRDEKSCSRQNEKSLSEQVNTLNNYLAGWAACYPEAWANRRDYIMCKAQGLSMIFGVYPQLYEYLKIKTGTCALFSADDYAEAVKDCFYHCDSRFGNSCILMSELSDQYGSVPFDWSSKNMKSQSSGSGINTMTALLRARISRVGAMLLPETDDFSDEDEEDEDII